MIRILLALVLCCCASFSTAAPAPAPGKAPKSKPVPAPDGERFLFIVEISSAMGKMQAETEAALFELIGSGVNRQMRPGDTYGVWTYNNETFAGEFPMQIWDSRNSTQLGTIAAAYLSEREFKKSGDVKRLMATLNAVVHSVSNLNIFIISKGDSSMSGTPFDKVINGQYKAQSRARKEAGKPFITALVARDGWIIDGSVAISGAPIKLPDRSTPTIAEKKPDSAPKPAIVAPTPTNSVPPQISSAPKATPAPSEAQPTPAATLTSNAEPVAQPPVTVPAPRPRVMQIITKSNTVETASATSAAAPTPTEPSVAITSTPTNAPVQSVSIPEPASTVNTTLAAPAPVETAEPPRDAVPLEGALAALLPQPVVVSARELSAEGDSAKSQAPGAIQATAMPAANGLQPGMMLAFGAALLAAAAFLLFVVFRRYRSLPQGSLITQSMDHR